MVNTCFPFGLNVTPETANPHQRASPRGCPVLASQKRAALSSLPVRIVLLSGLNSTDMTRPSCTRRLPKGALVATSQSRAVLPAAVTKVLPSGLKFPNAEASCWSASPAGLPMFVSQSRTVLSALPVRSILPSELNATAPTHARCFRGRSRGFLSPRPTAERYCPGCRWRPSCRRDERQRRELCLDAGVAHRSASPCSHPRAGQSNCQLP